MFSCLRWISLFWLVAIGISYAQITTVMLSQGGEPVELSCEGQADSGFTYQWYRKSSYSTNTMLPIAGADSSHYVTDSFPDREVRHYYCVVSSPDGESAISNAVVAAYTGLPVVNINTVEGEEPSAEYVYAPDGLNGRGITNASKVPASMEIVDGNGNLLYESGEYVQKESGLTVRIRGNTSVDLAGKSSYKLKLQKKADLLAPLISRSDDSFRNKDWILLKTTRTLDTFIGFTVCDILGTPWTPKYAFVELVVNNDYRGLYLLMESVSRDESRVDVSKSGYIIENDAYWWNEEVYFSTSKYKQKYTFKYPDDEDISEDRISYIKDFMDSLEEHLRDGSYNEYIDVESFARWLLVHDILGSFDAAGSNIFMSKYDTTSETKLNMVTNWDFDSNFRQEGNWSKQHDAEVAYAPFLFRSDDPKFAETYLALFDSLAPDLWNSVEQALNRLDSISGRQINLSRYCDWVRWNYDWWRSMEYDIYIAKNWFSARETWIRTMLENPRAVSYELNGGEFESDAVYPDSVHFSDNVAIPQPRKEGHCFSGWTSEQDTVFKVNLVLHGYKIVNDVLLNAHWSEDSSCVKNAPAPDTVEVIEGIGDALPLKTFALEKAPLEVFSSLGQYLGRIGAETLWGLRSGRDFSTTLKQAGYMSGVYLLRGDGQVLRVQVK